MPLRFLIEHKGLASQGFFLFSLFVFFAAFAAFTLFVAFRPASEVEGKQKEIKGMQKEVEGKQAIEAPDFTPVVRLERLDRPEVDEGGTF